VTGVALAVEVDLRIHANVVSDVALREGQETRPSGYKRTVPLKGFQRVIDKVIYGNVGERRLVAPIHLDCDFATQVAFALERIELILFVTGKPVDCTKHLITRIARVERIALA